MRVFEHPNMTDFRCPICLQGEDKPVILMPIPGTKDGNVCQAQQVHLACFKEWVCYFAEAEVDQQEAVFNA